MSPNPRPISLISPRPRPGSEIEHRNFPGPHANAAPFHFELPMNTSAASAITVRVALFARYAELFGTTALSVALPAGATVRDLTAALRLLPGGDRLPARPLCAVNLHQASDDTTLSADDEIALLPPIAGG